MYFLLDKTKLEMSDDDSAAAFPNMTRTSWNWAHDGASSNGIIEFLPSGETRWNNGEKQGFWKVNDSGKVLETRFNGIHHTLKYMADEKKAVLVIPNRSPASTMKMKGEYYFISFCIPGISHLMIKDVLDYRAALSLSFRRISI